MLSLLLLKPDAEVYFRCHPPCALVRVRISRSLYLVFSWTSPPLPPQPFRAVVAATIGFTLLRPPSSSPLLVFFLPPCFLLSFRHPAVMSGLGPVVVVLPGLVGGLQHRVFLASWSCASCDMKCHLALIGYIIFSFLFFFVDALARLQLYRLGSSSVSFLFSPPDHPPCARSSLSWFALLAMTIVVLYLFLFSSFPPSPIVPFHPHSPASLFSHFPWPIFNFPCFPSCISVCLWSLHVFVISPLLFSCSFFLWPSCITQYDVSRYRPSVACSTIRRAAAHRPYTTEHHRLRCSLERATPGETSRRRDP